MVKTVFVIGAGTGVDFGMPMGAELIRNIAQLFKDYEGFIHPEVLELDLYKAIEGYMDARNVSRGRVGLLRDTLKHPALDRLSSGIHFAKSIDTLINDAADEYVKDIGKILISYVLSEAERKVKVINPDSLSKEEFKKPSPTINAFGPPGPGNFSDTWFTAFFRDLRAGLSRDDFQIRLRDTAIINFNYDRLIEHFLGVALRQYDGLTPEKADELLSSMTHIHPYGVLAEPARVPVGTLNVNHVAKAPDNIRTFDEGAENKDHTRIQELMQNAERIVFLGYGFHRQNNDLLGLGALSGKRIWGTGVNISDERRAFIAKNIGAATGDAASNTVRIEKLTARELIDEFGEDFFLA